jgi:hypothetical protein
MSITIKIVGNNLPDVNEPMISLGRSLIGLRGAYNLISGHFPEDDDGDTDDKIEVYKDLIAELDLENNGAFHDKALWQYFDRQGKEEKLVAIECARFMKLTIEEYNGSILRSRLRRDAVRFFLYLKAGYEIIWEKG